MCRFGILIDRKTWIFYNCLEFFSSLGQFARSAFRSAVFEGCFIWSTESVPEFTRAKTFNYRNTGVWCGTFVCFEKFMIYRLCLSSNSSKQQNWKEERVKTQPSRAIGVARGSLWSVLIQVVKIRKDIKSILK